MSLVSILVGHKDISLGLGCSASLMCSEMFASPFLSKGFSLTLCKGGFAMPCV